MSKPSLEKQVLSSAVTSVVSAIGIVLVGASLFIGYGSLDKAKTDLNKTQTALTSTQANLSMANDEKTKAEVEAKSANAALAKNEQVIQQLLDSRGKEGETIQGLLKDNQNLKTENLKLTAQIQELKKLPVNTGGDGKLQAEIDRLREALRNCEQSGKDKDAQIGQLNGQIETLKAANVRLIEALKKCEQSGKDKDAQIEKLNSTILNLKAGTTGGNGSKIITRNPTQKTGWILIGRFIKDKWTGTTLDIPEQTPPKELPNRKLRSLRDLNATENVPGTSVNGAGETVFNVKTGQIVVILEIQAGQRDLYYARVQQQN